MASKVNHIEQFILDKKQKHTSKGCGPQVSIINADDLETFSVEGKAKIMAVEIVTDKPYSCLCQKAAREKSLGHNKDKFEYSFNIFKADQIFDYLLM